MYHGIFPGIILLPKKLVLTQTMNPLNPFPRIQLRMWTLAELATGEWSWCRLRDSANSQGGRLKLQFKAILAALAWPLFRKLPHWIWKHLETIPEDIFCHMAVWFAALLGGLLSLDTKRHDVLRPPRPSSDLRLSRCWSKSTRTWPGSYGAFLVSRLQFEFEQFSIKHLNIIYVIIYIYVYIYIYIIRSKYDINILIYIHT